MKTKSQEIHMEFGDNITIKFPYGHTIQLYACHPHDNPVVYTKEVGKANEKMFLITDSGAFKKLPTPKKA